MASTVELDVLFLGTGTSHGVPMIGCDCAVCRSPDLHDFRDRCSLYLSSGDQRILIDTSPELRHQCLKWNVRRVDAVLYTHHHADHVMGLDDLRRFNWLSHGVLPVYGQAATLDRLRIMFPYAFVGAGPSASSRPELVPHAIGEGPFRVGSLWITPIPLNHGTMPVLGFRIGRFAYCTDCNAISESSQALLGDLDVLVLDALRLRPHPTHFNLAQAIEMAHRIGAKTTYFTHIAHDIGHAAIEPTLPPGMHLAYDGLRLILAMSSTLSPHLPTTT